MSLLVRKIERAKWPSTNTEIAIDCIPADAITNCMKTQNNTLSTWCIENDTQIDDAVLAIVCGNKYLDSIDIVWVDQHQLEAHGITSQVTPGKTAFTEFVDHHVNLKDLNYKSLGQIALYIMNCILENNAKRYTRGMLKKLLIDAIASGKLQEEGLDSSLSEKLR